MATTTPPTPRQGRRAKGGLRRRIGRLGKQMVTSIFGEDRYLQARAMHYLRRRRRLGQDLLLVHTMGKVGSTTVAASLRARGIRQSALMYQPHFISDAGRAFAERLATEGVGGWERLARKERGGFLRNRVLAGELARMRAAGERVKVIAMVRDPVATNLSGLFHNHIWWPAALKNGCAEPTADCLAALRRYFLDHYPHDVPDTWFDMEVRPLYGIDVYAQPFDPERGYAIYRNEFADVLVLKLEKLNACAAAAFHDFLGWPDFRLVESNTAEDKSYANLYKAFRRELTLPAEYVERLYGSRHARHFYSDVELDAFRRKWQTAHRSG